MVLPEVMLTKMFSIFISNSYSLYREIW